jgi:hypothetical protein
MMVSWTAMSSVGNRIGSKQSGKKISPGGTFDSSAVRSAGKLCKKICPSRADDRTPGSWSTYSFASTSNYRSSLPGRTCLLYDFPALRTGLLLNVPPGNKWAFRKRKRSIKSVNAKRPGALLKCSRKGAHSQEVVLAVRRAA